MNPTIHQAVQTIVDEISPMNGSTYTSTANGHDGNILAAVIVTKDPHTIKILVDAGILTAPSLEDDVR